MVPLGYSLFFYLLKIDYSSKRSKTLTVRTNSFKTKKAAEPITIKYICYHCINAQM